MFEIVDDSPVSEFLKFMHVIKVKLKFIVFTLFQRGVKTKIISPDPNKTSFEIGRRLFIRCVLIYLSCNDFTLLL